MASASPPNSHSPPLKTYFKTPEGRYKLHYEKSHPTGIVHASNYKPIAQVTIAHLKERSAPQAPTTPTGQSSSSGGALRYAAAKFLGGGNGGRSLNFVGGNGGTRGCAGVGKAAMSTGAAGGSNAAAANYDGKGTYLIYNAGDTLFISDLNTHDRDPLKSIHFSSVNPLRHSFNADARDGHDLLIGCSNGDVYTVSLRQQLQDTGKKLVGVQHYNKDASVSGSRCTSVAWCPGGDGIFASAHGDGNIYIYEKTKDGAADPSFPAIKDPSQFAVSHARSSKSNPIVRWHVCSGPINCIAFSADGSYLAAVGRDGYLRVFDFSKEQLVFGGKSYYGALLCCAWSPDGKYILTGGEDDLVQVWSMEERRIVAWGEGHNSWVSGVSFDPHWTQPSSDDAEENVVYRFGSVGQDTQLLLWDLVMDELVVPLRRPPGGSPTFSTGSPSAKWDNIIPHGTLQPSPSVRDVPKLSPVVAHRAHMEPLSSFLFTRDSVVTCCREGHLKVWARPGVDSSLSSTSETTTAGVGAKDRTALPPIKTGSMGYRPSPILVSITALIYLQAFSVIYFYIHTLKMLTHSIVTFRVKSCDRCWTPENTKVCISKTEWGSRMLQNNLPF